VSAKSQSNQKKVINNIYSISDEYCEACLARLINDEEEIIEGLELRMKKVDNNILTIDNEIN
jgi:hypothetical protein